MMEGAQMTAKQAQETLEADRQRRFTAVNEGITALLEQHGCSLVGVPKIVNGSIVAEVQIIAR
jgi:hypothetical protein